jgi:hypothetical protein
MGAHQAILFEQWLPAIGVHLDPYQGYDPSIDPSISNVFSGAAFRLGHTLVNTRQLRLDAAGAPIPQGHRTLRESFFNPLIVKDEGGIEPILRGMASQLQQELDSGVIDDLRNFLFGLPGAGGTDLVALNINRGRERGLADYNTIRVDMGLARKETFAQITSDTDLQRKLEELYGSVDNIDAWVGFVIEDHVPGAGLGETDMTILKEQFTRLRDGDRFYYEIDPGLSQAEINAIRNTTLADIVRRTTEFDPPTENLFFVGTGTGKESISERPEQIGPTFDYVYPNPVSSYFNVEIGSPQAETVELQIVDVLGRVVKVLSLSLHPGTNRIRTDLPSRLAPGLYLISIRSATSFQTRRVMRLADG